MIVVAHNHLWDVPGQPIAPDVNAGNAERFLHHMDENGVQYAIVVCHLDEHDPMNNERALVRAKQFPTRFKIWVNVHLDKPEALERVKEYLGTAGLVGVSYYMQFSQDDTGEWMKPGPLFDAIAENNLSVNLNLRPAYQPQLRELAKAYPTVPFLRWGMVSRPAMGHGLQTLPLQFNALPNPSARSGCCGGRTIRRRCVT